MLAPTASTPRLWLPEFSRLARSGASVDGSFLCAMAADGEVKVSEEDGTVEVVMTSETPDRDKDVVAQAGLDFAAYKRNPVVLWAHDHRVPSIARSVEITQDGAKTLSRDTFDLGDPFAESIYRKVVGKFLRGVSIGGWPNKWARNEKRGGLDVLELDVWEHSFCNVPAHPDALARAAAAEGHSLEDDPVFQWAMELLASAKGEGLWLPKATAEALVAGLKLTKGLALFELSAEEVPAALAPEGSAEGGPEEVVGDGEGDAGEGGQLAPEPPPVEPTQAAILSTLQAIERRLAASAPASAPSAPSNLPLPGADVIAAEIRRSLNAGLLATLGRGLD